MGGMGNTENTTVKTAEPTVLETSMSIPTALKAADAEG